MPILLGPSHHHEGMGFGDKHGMKAVPTLSHSISLHALVDGGKGSAASHDRIRVLTPREIALLSEYNNRTLTTNTTTTATTTNVAESSATLPFTVFDARAHTILGAHPSLTCILSTSEAPLWHEAGIYLPATQEVLVTSNRLGDGVKISLIARTAAAATDSSGWASVELPHLTASVPMANGGTNLGPDDVLLCAQGTSTARAGLVRLRRDGGGWAAAEYVLDHYHGRPFNSPNDVVVTRRCAKGRRLVWFTDPHYGHEQGFRPRPRLPPQVYCWDPSTGAVRVVADGFGHPNGIAFSPDEDRCYITDTDMVAGDGQLDEARVATIYKMHVVDAGDGNPTLTGKTVFAMADTGVPDGIKCDIHGNVYAGCGDGLNVWSPGGTLLFKVLVPGGVANFCFCEDGHIMLFNETKTWLLKLDSGHRGALLEALRLESPPYGA